MRKLSYLPQVVLVTGLVMGLPVALISLLHSSGALTSVPLLITIAVAASLALTWAGAAIWKRRRGGVDLLFGELMLWGWLRRLWSERRLTQAMGATKGAKATGGLSPAEWMDRLRRLSTALEASDPYTHGHSRRVARHSASIAKRLRLPADQVARVRTAAAVHDVGKVNVPAAVLNKAGDLTDAEFELIKRHAADGAEMVAALGDPELTRSVLHHHERLDGTGYPAGLAGDEIPIGARIIAVADTFDAITSTRSYRPAKTHREALAVLAGEAGARLDPTAVRVFLTHYSDSRPLALWTALISGPERLVAMVGGGVNAASTAAAGAAVAVVAALAPGLIGSPDTSDAGLAAGSPAPVAQTAAPRGSSSAADSRRPGKSGAKRVRSERPGRTEGPAGAGAQSGPPAAPIAATPPVGQAPPTPPPATAAGPTQTVAAPPSGGNTSEPPTRPGGGPGEPPPPGDPGAEIHLLPHLPAGPHLPHVPGFEN